MKQFLTILTLAGVFGFATAAQASLPGDTLPLQPRNNTLTSVDLQTVDMLADCYYGGGGYRGYSYGYAPVRRSYYRPGSGVSIRIGGGGRGFGYPAYRGGFGGYPYRGGFGPGFGYGPGFGRGRSGVGLFLNF